MEFLMRAEGVRIQNLCFSYTPGKPVLRDVSLDIQPNEKFGIIGPSGAGKSTLLLHLNGILSGGGTIHIGETPVSPESLAPIREKVGLVFQNPDDQLFNPTVEEDVAFGPLNFGLSPEKVRERVTAALADMNLTGLEKSAPHHLSLGERKRAALATVLAMRPAVIAFDEPFSNLDPAMVLQLVNRIQALETTLIVISQSIFPLVACCDRMAILNEGRIAAVGAPGALAGNARLMRENGLDLSLYRSVCEGLFKV